MIRLTRTTTTSLAFALLAAMSASTHAQQPRRNARLFLQPMVTLAQLEEVQKELKLTDEQKTKAADLQQRLRDERQTIWQDAAGDWDKVREETNKLNAEIAKEFSGALDEGQQKRLLEIFVQVNGPVALQDPAIVEALKFSDEQKTKLEQAITDNRQKWFDAFQDFQNMSDEERAAKTDELIKDRDEALVAVMTDEQKKSLETMKGAALEIDLEKLPNPFGR
jgi:hypothetical protein